MQKVTDTVCISDAALSETSGKLAIRSFKAYPYDVVPEAALKMAGKLDHILVKGLKVQDGTLPIVLDAAQVPKKAFSPSDHYAIKASLV